MKSKAWFVGLSVAVCGSIAFAQSETFDGPYSGVPPTVLQQGWNHAQDPWSSAFAYYQLSPGRVGGSAQAIRVTNGNAFAYRVFTGLEAGKAYTIRIWIMTRPASGGAGQPGVSTWVEFGYDANGGTDGSTGTFNVEPKFDYANNAGTYVQYSEPGVVVGAGGNLTVFLKVGAAGDNTGIEAQFDDLSIEPDAGPGDESYPFPDDFEGQYSVAGSAPHWVQRFLPGGTQPRWAAGTGRSGSGQRLYTPPEASNRRIRIGVAKRFQVEQGLPARLLVWMRGSDSFGGEFTDIDQNETGPWAGMGYDLTAQLTNAFAETVHWSTEEATLYFFDALHVNQWYPIVSPVFVPSATTISVWLWAEGDNEDGIDVTFDDLEVYVAPAPDSDGDGRLDADEALSLTDVPADRTSGYLPDSDGDGMSDPTEDYNEDGDYDPATEPNPRQTDTDGDKISDGVEVFIMGTNPLVAGSFTDADQDGLPAAVDPNEASPDTDGDKFKDGYEAVYFDSLDGVTSATMVPALGDPSGDGAVSNLDALMLQSLFVGNILPTSPPFRTTLGYTKGDVNRDGFITNLDALVTQSFFIGNLGLLPL